MTESAARIPRMEFLSGRLSLGFCNTVALPDAADRFADPASFAGWATRAGHPLGGTPDLQDFREILDLRKNLRAIFNALSDGLPPPAAALDGLAGVAAPTRLVWDNEANRAIPAAAGDQFAQLRQAVVGDAIDLLTGTRQDRIKRCPAHDCRWFFFDTSRNGTRRWCAMANCGVRDKVQRYRHRHAPFQAYIAD